MSTETESPNYMLPLALIACTIAVLLGSQVGSSKQSTRIMKWQSETLQKQIENEEIDIICTGHGGCTPKGLGRNQLIDLIARL